MTGPVCKFNNGEGVCRTAPATLNLLNIPKVTIYIIFRKIGPPLHVGASEDDKKPLHNNFCFLDKTKSLFLSKNKIKKTCQQIKSIKHRKDNC